MSGSAEASRPLHVVVVLTHPIQYFSPLFTELTHRGVVRLCVIYGNDAGVRHAFDRGFGHDLSWDLDILSGYRYHILTTGPRRLGWLGLRGSWRLVRALAGSEVLVIHGYSTPISAIAIVYARVTRKPYLMRSDTTVLPAGLRWDLRRWWARAVVRGAAGVLASGSRNADVYRRLGVRRIFLAPFSIDVQRFVAASRMSQVQRSLLRSELGIPHDAKVVVFVGKLTPHKRPQDLIRAMELLAEPPLVVFVGDGPMRHELEKMSPDTVFYTGFRNQSEMPRLMAACDVLVLPSEEEPWGLVVNEGLACGLVPVVSESVGCAPDLVAGTGVIFPVGDLAALAAGIEQAFEIRGSPSFLSSRAQHLQDHSVAATARGYEEAARQLPITRA